MYRNHPLTSGPNIRSFTRSVSATLCLLVSSSLLWPLSSEARPKRKAKRAKSPVERLDEASLTAVRGVYQDLKDIPNPEVRVAVTQGLVELGGEDRQGAIERGLKAGDLGVKLIALAEVFKDPRGQKAQLKTAEGMLWELLSSSEEPEYQGGVTLLKSHFSKRAQNKWVKRLLKSDSKHGAHFAREVVIGRGGREAWRVIEAGLKEPSDHRAHKQAIEAMKAKRYPQAERWALAHSGDRGDDGLVAKAWIDQVSPKKARKMNQGLLKQYKRAEGDFPRRVRLAHLLSNRGLLSEVRDTLVIAVKNKKGRINEELDTAQLRVMGWEGLANCRDHAVLESVKGMMVNLQNREEAIPAVAWLEAWVRDTNDPSAKRLLEEMSQQTQYVSRLESIKALGSLRLRDSLPIIQEALLKGNEDLRVAAAQGLAKMVVKGDEQLLEEALSNERRSDEVRLALLDGLARIGTKETLQTAKYWLFKGKGDVQRAALEAVARVPLNQQELERILSGKYRNHPDKELRMRVWELLLRAQSDKLKRAFTSASSWLEVDQLKRLGALKPFPEELILQVAISTDQALSFAALELIKERGDSSLSTLMEVFKQSNEPKMIVRAVEVLGTLKGAEGVSTYLELLKSRDDIVRAAGLEALYAFGAEAERQVVRDMIDNERSPLPRAQAARAFVAIASRAPAPEPEGKGKGKGKGKGRSKGKGK